MNIYICGPITSLGVEEAKRRFEQAKEIIRLRGWTPISPMDNGLPVESAWEEHMKADLALMVQCDGILLLDGWRSSKGAKLEIYLAVQLKIPIVGSVTQSSEGTERSFVEIYETPPTKPIRIT